MEITRAARFGPALARDNVPFILDPRLQEVASFGSDKGLDVPDLKAWLRDVEKTGEKKVAFDWEKIDLSDVKEGWNSKEGYWAYTKSALTARATDVRNALFKRPEEHIIVVSHGAIAHFITEDWEVDNPMTGTTWANCEVRDYLFSEASEEGNAHLVETAKSVGRRPKYVRTGEKDQHVVQELEMVEDQ
ncbi:hypothetical protein N0V90_007282 [Kalmusia sp. IMI 367209]|nr:hypothetical protein N0V90_007282 [Kalmusia sp. IMI 367209]